MDEILSIVGFDKVKNNIDILKKEYSLHKNLIRNQSNFFIFPDAIFKEINDTVNIINVLNQDKNTDPCEIKEVYNSLSQKIYTFYNEIKISSYENVIFNKIKFVMEELIRFTQNTDLKMDKIPDRDELSQNLIFQNEQERINNMNNFDSGYLQNENEKENEINNSPKNISENINFSEINFQNEIDDNDKAGDFINEAYKPNNYLEIKGKYNYICYYANYFVKDASFNKESLEFIKTNFPECKLLYDFKKVQEELIIKQCKINKDKLDFKYNFIIPNLDLKFEKAGEFYYPPYGWFGYGLNIKNIYKNNINQNIPKANAYFGFKDMNYKEIKKMLNKIIMNNDLAIDIKKQPKCGFLDKRNKENKKVGNGIYLSPNINNIEQNTGIIYFNQKAYKIALMARVSPKEIRQPDNDDWILLPNQIEFIRILFKEIYIPKED